MWKCHAKKKIVKFLEGHLSLALLLLGVLLGAWSMVGATVNPGHGWTEIGDGRFIVTGPSSARSYTFPDVSTTVLTTSSLVSIAQGGTGQSSFGGVGNPRVVTSNGSVFSYKNMTSSGLLIGTSAAQTLSNLTIDVWNNSIIDNSMAAGDLLKSNGSKFVRFGTTTPLAYVQVNAAGTDLQWSTIAASAAGSSGELQYNSGGSSWGATSSLAISGDVLSLDHTLSLGAVSLPSTSTTGTIKLFNRKNAGREMLEFRTEVNDDYSSLQPNLFNNYFCWVRPSAAALTSLGCPVLSSAGSVSVTEAFGLNYTWTFNATASYMYVNTQNFIRGTVAGGQNGFFYFVRTSLPDASYSNSSGVRLVYGLSDQTTSNSCGSDNVTNQDMIAFNYSTALSANWRVAADDGSASVPTYVDTGMAFATGTYDFYLYAPAYPDISNIYWRADYLDTGSTVEGSANTQLPQASTFLYGVACADSVSNVTRNFRIATMYLEVPK